MSLAVPGGGAIPCRLFICGERPGYEEIRARKGFVGPAGQELWARLKAVTGLTRADCYVTNLVKTFSKEPPSPEEIREWEPELLRELKEVQPECIMTVGYHAARWFLPQFAGKGGEHFHGLVFRYTSPAVRQSSAYLVPVVHSSAALGQPARYQSQLTRDLQMVGRLLRDPAAWVHDPHPPMAFEVGLATLSGDAGDEAVGLDTEGSLDRPWTVEAISLSAHPTRGTVVETFQRGADTPALVPVQEILDAASRLTIHHSKHDVKGLQGLGLRVSWRKIDDTMVMAYLLNLPRGLKELMNRRHEWAMSDYEDLVLPLDEAAVREALTTTLTHGTTEWDVYEAARTAAKKARKARLRGKVALPVAVPDEPTLPKRALTSMRGMLTKPTDTTLRDRWSSSTFAEAVPLPPHKTWKDLPKATRTTYALTDAIAHRTLGEDLWRLIERRGLEDVYRIDMSVLPLLTRNERVGLLCDRKKLERLSRDFREEFHQTREEINDLAGFPVNPLSGDQVSDCLFEELGIEPTRRTKSGKHYTTADKYLKARRREHEIISKILTARQLSKYLGTYTEKLPTLLQQDHDGQWRYFPDWKYTATDTGRLAEGIIILIPKHDPLAKAQGRRNRAKMIRNAFHAGSGRTLVSVDLSQIELRVMAHLSQDKGLLDAFHSGEDIHARVAYELLGAPREKKDQDESAHRLPAKIVNFGIINGMTEFGLLDQLHEAGQLHWTIAMMRELLDGWWDTHPGVESYWHGQIDHAYDHGWIREGLFGRRREVHAIWSTDDRVYAEAKRQCLFAIQSAADTISKVWNAALWRQVIRPRQRKGQYCEFWVRVHDDTTLEVDEREADQVKAEMLGLVPQLLDIPTLAEGKMADRWGDL